MKYYIINIHVIKYFLNKNNENFVYDDDKKITISNLKDLKENGKSLKKLMYDYLKENTNDLCIRRLEYEEK